MKCNLTQGKLFKRLAAFVGLPLIFVFIAYLIIYLIANPIIAPVMSLMSLLVSDEVPDFTGYKVSKSNVDFVIDSEMSGVLTLDDIDFPQIGGVYAHITIPGTGVDCDVYYGDTNAILKKGPGQSVWSKLPGYGSTTLVAAHVTTHFKGLQYVKIGDTINYNTTYGSYVYRVKDILVVDMNDASTVYNLRADYDNLVLYTCYPFYAVAFRSQRYFVCAELVSGPKVDIYLD